MVKYLITLIFTLSFISCSSSGDEDGGIAVTPVVESYVLSVSGNFPVDGTYGVGATLDFQITWAEAINVTGSPRLVIDIGGTPRYANFTSGSGTSILTFSYTIAAGDSDGDGISVNTTIDQNSANLLGLSGDSASLNLAALGLDTSNIFVDTVTLGPDQVTSLTTAPTTSSTSLSASWTAPNDNGTAIQYYVLQYREQGSINWINVSPAPVTNSAVITSLSSGTTYEFRVAANNGILGAYSNIQTAEIFDIMSFSPIAWLDATDINADGSSPNNGDLVSTWVDKTGIADDATEANPAAQPVYTDNAQNGLSAVRFDNLATGLSANFPRSNGTDLTIIVVGQYDNGSVDKCMFEFIGTSSARAFFIDRRYASNNFYSPSLTTGGFHLWRIENAGAFATVTEDGVTQLYSGATNFNTDFTGTGTYYLGDDSTGGNRMNGFIGELLIFDSALSASDISKIESYLMTKWGI